MRTSSSVDLALVRRHDVPNRRHRTRACRVGYTVGHFSPLRDESSLDASLAFARARVRAHRVDASTKSTPSRVFASSSPVVVSRLDRRPASTRPSGSTHSQPLRLHVLSNTSTCNIQYISIHLLKTHNHGRAALHRSLRSTRRIRPSRDDTPTRALDASVDDTPRRRLATASRRASR